MKNIRKMNTSEKAATVAASIAVFGMTAAQIHAQDVEPMTEQAPVIETANTAQTEQGNSSENQ